MLFFFPFLVFPFRNSEFPMKRLATVIKLVHKGLRCMLEKPTIQQIFHPAIVTCLTDGTVVAHVISFLQRTHGQIWCLSLRDTNHAPRTISVSENNMHLVNGSALKYVNKQNTSDVVESQTNASPKYGESDIEADVLLQDSLRLMQLSKYAPLTDEAAVIQISLIKFCTWIEPHVDSLISTRNFAELRDLFDAMARLCQNALGFDCFAQGSHNKSSSFSRMCHSFHSGNMSMIGNLLSNDDESQSQRKSGKQSKLRGNYSHNKKCTSRNNLNLFQTSKGNFFSTGYHKKFQHLSDDCQSNGGVCSNFGRKEIDESSTHQQNDQQHQQTLLQANNVMHEQQDHRGATFRLVQRKVAKPSDSIKNDFYSQLQLGKDEYKIHDDSRADIPEPSSLQQTTELHRQDGTSTLSHVITLYEQTLCTLVSKGHIAFAEALLKRETIAGHLTYHFICTMLESILPAVDDVIYHVAALVPATVCPSTDKNQGTSNTDDTPITELKSPYSSSALQRILLTFSVNLPSHLLGRMELLILQELGMCSKYVVIISQ